MDNNNITIKVNDYEELKNREGELYTAYPIIIDYNGEIWEIKRRYKHFFELYQALKNKFPEVELFEFPQKTIFKSADKLFRKESFHIFLNLLLTLQPMPLELEHFLEIRKHVQNGSYGSSRASFDSMNSIGSDSITSRASFDYIQPSLLSSTNSTNSTITNNNNNNNNLSSTTTSDQLISSTKIIENNKSITSITIIAYILLISTWIGTITWIYIKGTEYEKLLWSNIIILIITIYMIKSDRNITNVNKNNLTNELSNTSSTPINSNNSSINSTSISSKTKLSPSTSTISTTISPLPTVSTTTTSSSSSLNLSSDWLSELNGTWKIVKQENAVESWYPMAGINFLIRPIALTVLMTLIKTITIQGNIFEVERSFNGKKYWKASIKIGKSKDVAEVLETECDGVGSYFCCYINDVEKILYLEFEPLDQEKGIRVIHRRQILPNGQLKMFWEGVNLGNGTTGEMTTYFERVEKN